MKIAILGAGAMGGLFGGLLAEAGGDIRLIDVNQQHMDAISRVGLRLRTDAGERLIPIPIGRAESFEGVVDLLVVFTKGPHTQAALQSVKHLIGPDTWALTLQNGLGNGERLANALSPSRILIGMTNWPSDVRGAGDVASHGVGEVRLWSMDGGDSPKASQVAAFLSGAGLNAVADPAVMVSIWEKASFNAAMNALSAVTDSTVGQMADDEDLRAVAFAVVAEAVAVAQALGVPASQDKILAAVRHGFESHRPHKPSMLQDILAGRSTEIDSINGAIAEIGRSVGQIAPTIEALAHLVRAKERRVIASK